MADVYLKHHGVKGMKWGVRKDRRSQMVVGMSQQGEVAAVVSASLLAYGAIKAKSGMHNASESGEFNRMRAKGKEFVTRRSSWKKDPKLAEYKTVDDVFQNVVKPINPKYGYPGTKMNCLRCTFSYELRRRGYDVRATRTVEGRGQTEAGLINAVSPGEKILSNNMRKGLQQLAKKSDLASVLDKYSWGGKGDIQNINLKNQADNNTPAAQLYQGKAILDALSKNPNGARGELSTIYTIGGAHSVAWEVFDGKAVIIDNQNGQRLDRPESFLRYPPIQEAKQVRLDNIPLNDDFLKRWVK